MNRLAFSTLGCPGEPVGHVTRLARRHGYEGVELRCMDGEILTPSARAAELARVRDQFSAEGVGIVCVASYVQVAQPDPGAVNDLLRHVVIAEALGAPFVRVFGGGAHAPAVDRLGTVAARIAGSPVTVLLETHDSFLTGAAVAAICAEVASPQVGALWDVVNPWRAGETPQQTATALGGWLRHVQLKDVAAPSELAPVLPGRGAVPLRGVLRELARVHYGGWLSLEWERAWYPDAAPLEQPLAQLRSLLEEDLT
ncbi:sugar phosphate isomerase/epimerase family protein [Dactylosporangium sp. CA-233914]|uniref:sugar phosphate isomerase/epimerase family protein n=1 Tax=Dactylosporangium sp. CA-233914 TaxID=3239934 RepID=UPI003D933B12